MAVFSKKINFKDEKYCKVCRKKVKAGKSLPGYEDELEFVCSSCYKEYFKDIAAIERKPLLVNFRPARIIDGEYRVNNIFKRAIVEKTVGWMILGAVLWLGLWLSGIFFPDISAEMNTNGAVAILKYGFIPVALYTFCTLIGGIDSLRWLINGLKRGMDIPRRILLLVKSLLYSGIFIIHFSIISNFIAEY